MGMKYHNLNFLNMKVKECGMIQLNFWEYILRTIPESFIITYGIRLLSNKTGISKMKYVISSLILSVFVFFIRMFPISFGLHIIINIMITVSIMVIIGFPLIKSIYNTLFMYFIFSISEFINICILKMVNINLYLNDTNTIRKAATGIPSLFIVVIIILIIKFILKKEKKEMSIIESLSFRFGKLIKKN